MSFGARVYRGNLEDSSVYTDMEKIIPLGQGKKNQQLKKIEVLCTKRMSD